MLWLEDKLGGGGAAADRILNTFPPSLKLYSLITHPVFLQKLILSAVTLLADDVK